MRLATVRVDGRHHGALLEGDQLILHEEPDVRALLDEQERSGRLGTRLTRTIPLDEADFAPLVPEPSKVFCVGLNYRNHILEMGHELPSHPTLFAKFADSLVGAADPIVLPPVSHAPDWEVELTVVVGRTIRSASEKQAAAAIAGYTVGNDVSMRDWQNRTMQWLQGKAFADSTPIGPMLVTPDECGGAADLALTCSVNGTVMQSSRTSDLVFGPAELVSYCSKIVPLRPGDLILTGTPGGVGHARRPPLHLQPGDVVRSEISRLGTCENLCIAGAASPA